MAIIQAGGGDAMTGSRSNRLISHLVLLSTLLGLITPVLANTIGPIHAGFVLDGALKEWTKQPTTLSLIPKSAGARPGKVWVAQSPNEWGTAGRVAFDFVSNNLPVVWGTRNYNGPKDINARVQLWSDGQLVHLEVDVIDDILTIRDDPIQADHIEVWFAVPTLGQRKSENKYIKDPAGIFLFLYDGRPDVSAFKKALSTPSVRHRYEGGNDCDKLIQNMKSRLGIYQHFIGLVHWGLFPDARPATLYDRDHYDNSPLSLPIPAYEVERQLTGYRIKARFTPESLGFAAWDGIARLRVMVDVVDVDKTDRQETLLSTSGHRQWGEPATFRPITFKQPITIKLIPGIDWLGNPNAKSNPEVVAKLSSMFIFAGEKNWQGISRRVEPFRGYYEDYRGCDWNDPKMETVLFDYFPKVSYKKTNLENHIFEVIVGQGQQGQDHIFIDGRFAGAVDQFLEGFVFVDGTPGFFYKTIVEHVGPHYCGASTDYHLGAMRLDKKKRNFKLMSQNDCNLAGVHSIAGDIEGDWLGEENDHEIRWNKPGRSVIFTFKGSTLIGEWVPATLKVEFTWDKKGERVTGKILEVIERSARGGSP